MTTDPIEIPDAMAALTAPTVISVLVVPKDSATKGHEPPAPTSWALQVGVPNGGIGWQLDWVGTSGSLVDPATGGTPNPTTPSH